MQNLLHLSEQVQLGLPPLLRPIPPGHNPLLPPLKGQQKPIALILLLLQLLPLLLLLLLIDPQPQLQNNHHIILILLFDLVLDGLVGWVRTHFEDL